MEIMVHQQQQYSYYIQNYLKPLSPDQSEDVAALLSPAPTKQFYYPFTAHFLIV